MKLFCKHHWKRNDSIPLDQVDDKHVVECICVKCHEKKRFSRFDYDLIMKRQQLKEMGGEI